MTWPTNKTSADYTPAVAVLALAGMVGGQAVRHA